VTRPTLVLLLLCCCCCAAVLRLCTKAAMHGCWVLQQCTSKRAALAILEEYPRKVFPCRSGEGLTRRSATLAHLTLPGIISTRHYRIRVDSLTRAYRTVRAYQEANRARKRQAKAVRTVSETGSMYRTCTCYFIPELAAQTHLLAGQARDTKYVRVKSGTLSRCWS
jgi:hypothetical protein